MKNKHVVSFSQLEAEYLKRKGELDELQSKRARIIESIQEIDKAIACVNAGEPNPLSNSVQGEEKVNETTAIVKMDKAINEMSRRKKSAKIDGLTPATTLADHIVAAMKANNGPFSRLTLSELVRENGYKGNGKILSLISQIGHILTNDKRFKKTSYGVYDLKK